jgi:hypothetical protein
MRTNATMSRLASSATWQWIVRLQGSGLPSGRRGCADDLARVHRCAIESLSRMRRTRSSSAAFAGRARPAAPPRAQVRLAEKSPHVLAEHNGIAAAERVAVALLGAVAEGETRLAVVGLRLHDGVHEGVLIDHPRADRRQQGRRPLEQLEARRARSAW